MFKKDVKILNNRCIKSVVLEEKNGVYKEFPDRLNTEIVSFLRSQGIDKLYSHQYEMFQHAQKGENIIITTSTASGKTMSFLLPVLNRILEKPTSRSFFIYPTKALTRDQMKTLNPMIQYFGQNRFYAGIYDGDTQQNERQTVRKDANIILTNPEMIHAAFLPHHNKDYFRFIFENLDYVVIDELHYYRGVFGSHLANLIRRIKRICKYYGSDPQFFASSATIANPQELAENIFSDAFRLVEMDGSPKAEKEILFWIPPKISENDWRVPQQEAPLLLPEFVQKDYKFIAFSKNRQGLEVVLKETKSKLKESYENQHNSINYEEKVTGYRGGYTPMERRKIEKKLADGELSGVIATNALELGIDIGDIDVVVNMGFPYTKASFLQQIGRSGRKGEKSYAVLILNMYNTIDQFVFLNTDWLLDNKVENAIINKDNLHVQTAHLRAAAAELPLSLDDTALFPDMGEIVVLLMKAKELVKKDKYYFWNGGDFPAGDISLRGIDKNRYKVVNKMDNNLLTEMDEATAFREVHPQAIYTHEGRGYFCETLDLTDKKAIVRPSEDNYYTIPHIETMITPLHTRKSQLISASKKYFAGIKIQKQTTSFKKVQFNNHQNLGMEMIEMGLHKTMETEGLLLELPKQVSAFFSGLSSSGKTSPREYEDALSHVLLNAFLMRTMTSRHDVECTDSVLTIDSEDGVYIVIYDDYIGGLGFAEKGYEIAELIIQDAIKIIDKCECKDGCPACTGSFGIEKKLVSWALESFFAFPEEPDVVERDDMQLPGTTEEKRFQLHEIESVWPDYVALLASEESQEDGSQFLRNIPAVKYNNNTVFLVVSKYMDKSWVLENYGLVIKGLLKKYFEYDRANEFKIDLETGKMDEMKLRKIGKRHNDLKKGSI